MRSNSINIEVFKKVMKHNDTRIFYQLCSLKYQRNDSREIAGAVIAFYNDPRISVKENIIIKQHGRLETY